MKTTVTPNVQREFRAYDIRNNTMVYDSLKITETNQLVTVNADYFNSPFSFFDGCKWMMYTGMKDSKNTKIWEGDIIKVDELDTSSPTTGKQPVIQHFPKAVVVWDKALLAFTYNPIRPGIDYNDYSHQMLVYGGNIEVIGNVYDNPDLLQ